MLTDARGRLLQVVPHEPEPDRPADRAALPTPSPRLGGTAAVSRVVPAAAGGAAIVGFAIPFDTPHGRRVFSGAFDVKRGPLGAYLASVSPIKPSAVELVDPDGTVIASGRGPQARPPLREAGRGRAQDRRVTVEGNGVPDRRATGGRHAVAAGAGRARGEPLPAALPRRTLDPLGGLAILVLASLLVAVLVARLLKARTELVADIAKRERVELELSDSQTRFHRAFDEAPIGMALVDLDGKWRQVNRALCKMLRYTEAELLVHPRGAHASRRPGRRPRPGRRARVGGDRSRRVREALHRQRRRHRVDARVALAGPRCRRAPALLHRPDPGHLRAQALRGQLQHLADHDPLTGLFNRRRFEQELERAGRLAERYGTPAPCWCSTSTTSSTSTTRSGTRPATS